MFDTPILFIVFNRPEHTKRVFGAIRSIAPAKLYIAGDGPREGNESDRTNCMEIRDLLQHAIDWPCTVHYRFQDVNLGCGLAVSAAITWFFEQEEAGIILEDDCLPSTAFFQFAGAMLEKFKDQQQVMHINGTFLISSAFKKSPAPHFSLFAGIWGWATWRRAWQHYEFQLSNEISIKAIDYLKQQQLPIPYLRHWDTVFADMEMAKIDTWDYQWHAAIWAHQGKVISPGRNLVENIGFGEMATHTSDQHSPFANQPVWQGDGAALASGNWLRMRRDIDLKSVNWSLGTAVPVKGLQKLKKRLGNAWRRINKITVPFLNYVQ